MMLGMAQQLVDDARAFLDEAREAHFATERESTRLEAAMDDLRDFVDNLAAHNEKLRPLVDEAMKHALDLQKQAEMLARYVPHFRKYINVFIIVLDANRFHSHTLLVYFFRKTVEFIGRSLLWFQNIGRYEDFSWRSSKCIQSLSGYRRCY